MKFNINSILRDPNPIAMPLSLLPLIILAVRAVKKGRDQEHPKH